MHLFLTGFMGVGKTTIGKQLSDLLDFSFVDLDAHIEQKEKKTISSIFLEDGEAYFRTKERECIEDLLDQRGNYVIALGGGSLQNRDVAQQIFKSGICIYLYKPWADLAIQLSKLTNRPLLEQKSMVELELLFESRASLYELSQLKVPINSTFTLEKLAQTLRLSTNR
jgi:shikimate kinase